MTVITTNVKHRVRTTGLEHQGQTSISDPDQTFGFTCIFSSGMQEIDKNILCLDIPLFKAVLGSLRGVVVKPLAL